MLSGQCTVYLDTDTYIIDKMKKKSLRLKKKGFKLSLKYTFQAALTNLQAVFTPVWKPGTEFVT